MYHRDDPSSAAERFEEESVPLGEFIDFQRLAAPRSTPPWSGQLLRHQRSQGELILEEVPPAFNAGITGGAKLAALRTSKAFALLKKQPRGSPSNRHSLTFHPASRCRAAVNKASGVIALILFPQCPGFTRAGNEAPYSY